MEKRVLLAVSLSFVVLFVYQTFFVKPPVRPGAKPATAEPAAASAKPPSPVGGAAPAIAPPQAAATRAASTVADSSAREIVVESPDVRAVFNNRGAVLTSWVLKRFPDHNGKPVDVVAQEAGPDVPRGFALVFADPALTTEVQNALFRPSTTRIDLAAGRIPLVFEFEDASGLKVRKQFDFGVGGQPYLVSFSASASRGGQDLPVSFASGPGLGETARSGQASSFFAPNYYQKPEAIYHVNGSVTRVTGDKIPATPAVEGALRYVGMDDNYFLAAVLPGERVSRAEYQHITVQSGPDTRSLVSFTYNPAGPVSNVTLFLGPKQFDLLASVDRELVRVINFGIFSWVCVPLLRSLNWIHGYIGNYGWSIILLTIFINIVMFPLRHKSVVSMRRLQELQPEVKAIQERYAKYKATDPERQKMNAELMALYRERGANPASGCIPMLLTFPVLFAFYSLLSQAIELRGAPFMGWITDLSAYDPWHVTPLMMGGTMVWQQMITPTTADPVQQKVMMFMPIMFTFMFLWAPSGLVIYWFVSNLWAIGQQYLTTRLIGPASGKRQKAPAERKAKRIGSDGARG
jgi:YidC/Oxa1 family membrane protein insertase